MSGKMQQSVFDSLEKLPVAILWLDNKTILYANKKAREWIFRSDKYTTNLTHFYNLFHQQTKKRLKLFYNNLVLKKEEELTQAYIELLNGERFNVNANRPDPANKKTVQFVFSKIASTEEQQAAEYFIRNISDNGIDILFHLSQSKRTQLNYISDSVKKILGYSPGQLYKAPELLSAAVVPEDKHIFEFSAKKFANPAYAQKHKHFAIRLKHKNGEVKHLEFSVSPVLDRLGKCTGIMGNMRDVSKRKETEALLVETKEKFDLITNNGHEIIAFYTYLPDDKYYYVSPNIESILGYKPEELAADNFFLKKRVIERQDEFEKTDKLLKGYQKNNIIKSHTNFFKTRKKNGEEAWLENTFIPITNKAGTISFFMYIIRDITLQKEREIEIQQQYTNYQNLLDHSPVAYIIHDQGVCLYVNNAMMGLLRAENKSQVLGKFVMDFIVPAQRKKATRHIWELYARKTAAKKPQSYKFTDFEGNEVDVEERSVVIKFNNKDCVLSLLTNLSEKRQREKEKQKMITVEASNRLLEREIKERKEAKKNLTEITAHLMSIFESSTHILWTIDRQHKITSFNKNFLMAVKAERGREVKIGDRIDDLFTPDDKEDRDFWNQRYTEAFEGKKLEFENENRRDGKVYRKVFINPIYNARNEVKELSCIANDITDSKIYEQKLLNQTGKLTAIFDSSHHYIWTINREEKLTSFNKNYYDLVTTLYNTKPYVGLVLDRGVLSNDKEYTMLLKYHYDKAFNGVATSFEIETRDHEYKNVYLEIFLNPIYENNRVVEVSGIAHNTTEKKLVQQRMEVSLKEKEALLREVHHRVKNNMQVISSILNLQSSYVSDEYTLNLLKESQNRIKTMAYIHESLYQNKSFTSVNFSDYVQTLVNNIVQSYSYSGDNIQLELNIQNITLSLDSSIPAGLIINELITNAIKHAFPGGRKGIISFNLRCENNLVILELKDNGVGFAQGIDFENSHSLGLQLVNTLTEQIDGEIKFKSETNVGTEVTVTFKM